MCRPSPTPRVFPKFIVMVDTMTFGNCKRCPLLRAVCDTEVNGTISLMVRHDALVQFTVEGVVTIHATLSEMLQKINEHI